jgi:hypothetical protein
MHTFEPLEMQKMRKPPIDVQTGVTGGPETLPNPIMSPGTFSLSETMNPLTISPLESENFGLRMEHESLKDNIRNLQERLSELEQFQKKLTREIAPRTVVIEEISSEEARSRVKKFLREFKDEIYPDEISHELGIEFHIVMKIIEELEREGEIDILD